MEAKDTVLPVGRHNESVYCPSCGYEFGIKSKVEYERELQAEISFKAGIEQGFKQIDDEELIPKSFENGKKYGIKEVVEWIQNHGGCLDGSRLEWQAFLKEKGIE